MRILHLCLAAFYIDNYGYQENLLPRMHKQQGHQVLIVASTETYVDNKKLGYINPSEYINEDGIPVHRLPYVKWLPLSIIKRLRYYKGVYEELERFHPDFIFMHDAQFGSINAVVEYMKLHPNVRLNIDGHTDLINSARTFVSRNILHGIFYKRCLKKIEPFTNHFFGTLPNRVDFFKDVYGMPENKVKLLVMGADDSLVKKAKETNQRKAIREKYGINNDSFLLVSGGKFTKDKFDILKVMDAVKELSNLFDVKLLIFGSIGDEETFKTQFLSKCDDKTIIYVGWIKGNESYNYFEASDVVVFPGLHSVLWEQAVGQGKPCIFHKIVGQTHIDLGGNCLFIRQSTTEEIKQLIKEIMENYEKYNDIAQNKGLKVFSYYQIAKRSLE
jgi:glycosyltransferase, family 1